MRYFHKDGNILLCYLISVSYGLNKFAKVIDIKLVISFDN
jgi:hypothetical protein